MALVPLLLASFAPSVTGHGPAGRGTTAPAYTNSGPPLLSSPHRRPPRSHDARSETRPTLAATTEMTWIAGRAKPPAGARSRQSLRPARNTDVRPLQPRKPTEFARLRAVLAPSLPSSVSPRRGAALGLISNGAPLSAVDQRLAATWVHRASSGREGPRHRRKRARARGVAAGALSRFILDPRRPRCWGAGRGDLLRGSLLTSRLAVDYVAASSSNGVATRPNTTPCTRAKLRGRTATRLRSFGEQALRETTCRLSGGPFVTKWAGGANKKE